MCHNGVIRFFAILPLIAVIFYRNYWMSVSNIRVEAKILRLKSGNKLHLLKWQRDIDERFFCFILFRAILTLLGILLITLDRIKNENKLEISKNHESLRIGIKWYLFGTYQNDFIFARCFLWCLQKSIPNILIPHYMEEKFPIDLNRSVKKSIPMHICLREIHCYIHSMCA